jgi:ribonuclease HII
LNLLPVPDLSYELALIARGFDRVAGVDEAGRGPLAGPVVAAAVILPKKFSCEWLDDSKKMPKKRREIVYEKLVGDEAVVWAVGVVDAGEIDALNILRATHVAMGEAIDGLGVRPDMALVDGLRVKGLSVEHEALVKGDGKSLSIAAASVIAKVTRDRMMERMDEEFPEYGFIRNQGYGTKEHLEALKKYGPCRYHRRSFESVSQLTLPFG